MPKPAQIKYLIIHTSDSKWGSVEAIREWHTLPPPKGRGWADIGYHYVITNGFLTYQQLKDSKMSITANGKVWPGRDVDHDGDVDEEIGAHCLGYNDKSLGICLVGAHGIYTTEQMEALYATCLRLMARYSIPVANVLGHYETASGKAEGKTCPDYQCDKLRTELERLLRIFNNLK